MKKKRVFSGIQPSGRPHLGNYLGAIRQHIQMQDQYDTIYGVVDYHAMTTIHNGDELRANTVGVVLDYLACGLDPAKSLIIKQSDVPAHTELCWILNTITPVAWLERCPTYKDKKQQRAFDINHGLLTYPVLMAADIIIYKAELVPVGKDQLPHLELTREIVRAFNNTYGETFPEPQSRISEETAVVIGIDGEKKMSKSADNAIEIFLEPEDMRKRVMQMVTDVKKIYRKDPGHPDECNVFRFHQMFSTGDLALIEEPCRSGARGCADCKRELADYISAYFTDMREKRKELAKNLDYVHEVMRMSADKARALAAETMTEVRCKVGLD